MPAHSSLWPTVSSVSIAAVVVLAFVARPAAAGVEQDRQLLLELARCHEANRQAVLTWQGAARVTDRSEIAPGDPREGGFTAAFVRDNARGAVRWNLVFASPGAGEAAAPDERRLSGMVKDGRAYRFGPFRSDIPRDARRTLVIQPQQSERVQGLSDEFDPEFFFQAVDLDLASRLRFQAGLLGTPDPDIERRVRREGDRITLELMGTQRPALNRYVFDVSRGCNLVEYKGVSESVEEHWQWEFEQVNGCYVPSRVSYTNSRLEAGAFRPVFARHVDFERQTLNEPVSASAFALDALGLRPGDIVSDAQVGIQYNFKPELESVPDLDPISADITASPPDDAARAAGPELGEEASQAPARAPLSGQGLPQAAAPTANSVRVALWLAVLAAACVAVVAAWCIGTKAGRRRG